MTPRKMKPRLRRTPLAISLTADERKNMQAAADREGLPLAVWIRKTAISAIPK